MPQKRKSTSTRKKSSTPAASGRKGPSQRASVPQSESSGRERTPASARSADYQTGPRRPHRREIAAGICLILGIFSFIGYFDAEPVFISFFTGFVKCFIGHGFFALPPALIMCSVILAFHKGHPVRLRTISTICLAAVVGAIIHVFFFSEIEEFGEAVRKYSLSFAMIGDLWTDGGALEAGGIISGGISELFIVLFGKVGTIITFIIIAAILGLIAFNATVAGVLGAFSRKEKLRYTPDPDYDDIEEGESGLLSEADAAALEEIRRARNRQYRYPLIPQWKKKKIDIPLDEKARVGKDYFADDPISELYNTTPGAQPPDEVLQRSVSSDVPPGAGKSDKLHPDYDMQRQDEDMQRHIEDLPLDIPFMDGRMPRRHPVVPPIEEVRFATESDAGISPELYPNTPQQYFKPKEPVKKSPMPAVPEPEGPDAYNPNHSPAGNPAAGKNPDKPAGAVKPGIFDETSAGYSYPPLNLLSQGSPGGRSDNTEINTNIDRLEAAFQSFGININITGATRGPSVTRYEAELEAGIKLSRLTNLSDDIALALGTIGVRIAAMPNKRSTVGIEVPNKSVSKVHLRDIIESDEFTGSQSKLSFAIGMDISGDKVVGDIKKLPHLLIAGTTGSGKSVCLNSIILSLLYKSTPDEVRLIMIDPKMVEFKVYANIPHLLVPLVTEAKKAAGALQWATYEMMKRYNLFSDSGARDIEGYNKVAVKSNEEMKILPEVVIIIDELADLMLTAAKDVEESVCRIAQMGRAAGIHLVIATQSPRANVITGLMKANIPSRIAFKVASALESQIILDPGQNADKLVGNGDMLYSPTGIIKPMRVQGTWVSDKERERVVDFIEKASKACFDEEAVHDIDKIAEGKGESGGGNGGAKGDGSDGSDFDELLPQAVEILFEVGQGQASVSMLQRRLKLGYARAARIVDQMEEMGIVGQFEGSKPRTLLITKERWQEMQYIFGTAPQGPASSYNSRHNEGNDIYD